MEVHSNEVNRAYGFNPPPAGPDEPDKDSDDEGPETPLDEPRPPRVQDPPLEPEQTGPYVVRGQGW